MRLRRFTLRRYGVFDATTLVFDPTPGVVNLVVAPNGRGKSQLVHGFCDLLFGIHAQSPMDFRYDGYAAMRLEAEVEVDGRVVSLTRRKGRGNTLLDHAGAAIDPAVVKRWLGSVADRDRLLGLFALDSGRLRKAEGQLVDSDGALAEALLSGTGELHPIRELKATLERRRDEIGKPGSRKPKLNAACLEWEQAGKALRIATLMTPEMHGAQHRQWTQATADLKLAEAAHAAALQEGRRLSRMAITQPATALRVAALADLAGLHDAPLLDPLLGPEVEKAEAALVRAGDRLATARTAAEEAAALVAAYAAPAELFAQAGVIDALAAQLGAVEKAAADSPGLARDEAAALRDAAAQLHALGHAVPASKAASVIPARAVAGAALAAITVHGRLREAAAAATGRKCLAAADPALAPGWLDATPGQAVPPGLVALCTAIREDGAVGARQTEAEAAVAAADAALAATLARVPGWDDPAALIASAPPDISSFLRVEEAVQAATREVRQRQTLAQQATDASQQAAATVAAKTFGTPPGDEILAAIRARRDAGWDLVRLRAFAGPPDLAAEASFAKQPLEQAYREAVIAADTIADERFRGASTLADLRLAQHQQAAAALAASDAARAAAAAQDQQTIATAAWAEAVAPLHLPPTATIEDLRTVLTARDAAIVAREASAKAHSRADTLAARHGAWAADLAALVGARPDRPGGLAALLAEADRLVRESSAFEAGRTTRRVQAEAAAKADRRAADDQAIAETALGEWQAGWAAHLHALGRPPGEHPDVTAGLLGLCEELRELVTLATDRRQRIDAIADDRKTFVAQLAAVQDGLGVAGSGDIGADIRSLAGTLATARQAGAVAAGHGVAASDAADKLRRSAAAHQDAATTLRTILGQCGATTTAEARVRLGQSRDRQAALERLAAADRTILDAGGGLTLDALLAEAAGVAPDQLPGLRDAVDQAAKDGADRARRAAVSANELRRQLDSAEGAEDAQTALAAQMAALATAERTAEEALVLHLAATMLDRALKRVEDGQGDAGLARIGTLFGRMTAGDYSRVEAANLGGRARLRAIAAAWPKERKAMHELSDGTRDQLYLALRTAAIEDHLAVSPALPFIGDDILQTSDEDRTLATLQVMAELSQRTQTIIMTHHEHLVALAAKLPPRTVHVVRLHSEASQ